MYHTNIRRRRVEWYDDGCACGFRDACDYPRTIFRHFYNPRTTNRVYPYHTRGVDRRLVTAFWNGYLTGVEMALAAHN